MLVSTYQQSCNFVLLVPVKFTFLSQPFPKQQILDSPKIKEFADNLNFDENG